MWTPKIFGLCTRGSRESSMSILGWDLASCVSGVNNVTDDFGVDIPLIVLHSLVISVLRSMFSPNSLHFCRLCSQMRFWMSLFSLASSGEVRSLLRRSSGHHVQYLCWYRLLVESSRDIVRYCFE